ncbi:hypothetical protein JTB14_019504 [Gonioctena quinquepunctata]|nr:hypothetical protein JTB14_019504 [Gonioctena quinquepunctata]
MDLQGINAALVNNKETVKLSDLPQNQPQPILNIRIVKSKFGEILLVELQEHMVFPPRRAIEAISQNQSKFTPDK